ncbi:hypothetical protein V2I01_32060 [Micromonospora sp. BRA006-A]|nr:hypothetical protein [Micromonospora sp. BRA006-A]
MAVGGMALLHQVLGSDSYDLARARVATLLADIEAGRELALTTAVDDA